MMDLFDKLILSILNYCCEVWGFIPANTVERDNLYFCKKIRGVEKSTQNDFVYGKLDQISLSVCRCYIIIKYWLKILICDGRNYIKSR